MQRIPVPELCKWSSTVIEKAHISDFHFQRSETILVDPEFSAHAGQAYWPRGRSSLAGFHALIVEISLDNHLRRALGHNPAGAYPQNLVTHLLDERCIVR